MRCFYCGDFKFIHYCYACGHWVCSKPSCNAKSAKSAATEAGKTIWNTGKKVVNAIRGG